MIYQVYPSSYKDSDGNGIGDIQGVISKLDYIESLGVSAIWFNPLFVSGWIDGGYDVIDFYRVDPRFGTNNDLVELIRKAHDKGIKVMLDLVAGHTSDKHPWFLQSAQDSNLQYSDYYIRSDRLPDAKAEKDLETMLKSPDYMQSTIGKWMKSEYPRDKYYMKNFYACQPSVKDLYGNAWPEDKVDSKTTPAQMLKEYYDYFTDCVESTRTMGYFASITGNHDHLRINTGARNTPEQLKVMMAWVMTMPLPILYYGDEIGMRSLVDMPNVEGANHNGKERAGARTPMQWTADETAGFSNSLQTSFTFLSARTGLRHPHFLSTPSGKRNWPPGKSSRSPKETRPWSLRRMIRDPS